jgi:isoamylase
MQIKSAGSAIGKMVQHRPTCPTLRDDRQPERCAAAQPMEQTMIERAAWHGYFRGAPEMAGTDDPWAAAEGVPFPFGVTHVPLGDSYNFALYSKYATAIELLLYARSDPSTPCLVYRLDPKFNKSGRVWHCRLGRDMLGDAELYAYRIDGPRDLKAGHRFDPGKILLDPYARAIFFPPEFSRFTACHAGSNQGRAPLGVISPGAVPFDWRGDRRPWHTHDTIIYELHVRGFTERANSGVSAARRGTFLGLIDKIPYLQELGITAVELMPVFQFDPQEANYWGYMPVSFFAVHHAYASDSGLGCQIGEFKMLVRALHAASIEVILDVVYNHTGEGDQTGPTYNFRGIDNTTYYLLHDDRSRYRNDSGTGNTLHTANRYVRSMVLDSLRYWIKEMHVDGFRFDLASLFTRRSDGSINLDDPPIVESIQADPELSGARLIAEAWDSSSYQLGRTFPGRSWLQWNGRFRDDMRRFMNCNERNSEEAVLRLYGSDDLFPDTVMDAYHAFQSVNFICSHDGFCLNDLLAFTCKRNQANGHGNTDGPEINASWNCGWEGNAGAPDDVLRLRRKQAKNFFCLLMLANGTPMFVAGDEFLNTQGGNNNPYNQDNETTWLDWDLLDRNTEVFRFAKLMIAFRKQHPSLGRSRFWREDVCWYGPDGSVQPRSSALAFHLCGRSQNDVDLYVMINADDGDVAFRIQRTTADAWHRVIDTGRESPSDICEPGGTGGLVETEYRAAARSVVVLVSGGAPR